MRCKRGACQSGDSRTLRPRLPCGQRAGAESCISSHWATGKSLSTWSGAGPGDRVKGAVTGVGAPGVGVGVVVEPAGQPW